MNKQKLVVKVPEIVIDTNSGEIGVIDCYNETKNCMTVLFEDGSVSRYSINGIALDLQSNHQTLYNYNAQLHSNTLTVSLHQSVINTEGIVGKIIAITEPHFKVEFENGTTELYRYVDFAYDIQHEKYKKLKTLVNYDPTKHSKCKLIEVKHHDGTWRKRKLAFIWNNIAYCYNNQLTDSEIIDRKNHYILSDIIAYTEWREIRKEITLSELIQKAGFNPEHIHVGELTCEVGQKVYSEHYGNGVIIEILSNFYDIHHIKVKLDDYIALLFTTDGKLNKNNRYPELFNLVETEGLKKVLVRNNENQEWKVRFLQSVITKNKVICWSLDLHVEDIEMILDYDAEIKKDDLSVWNYHKEIPYVSIQELWDKANLNPDEYRLINNLN